MSNIPYFKYKLNTQNVKHENEQFYKLANDYVSQIKFDFAFDNE